MKEALIAAAIRCVGKSPLERLEWAVDFSRRAIVTPEDQLKAELELTCFMWARNLQADAKLSLPTQIKAIMTDFPKDSFHGEEVIQVQRRFTGTLAAAAGGRGVEMKLEYMKVRFTRAGGIVYYNTIPGNGAAKLEAVTYKLLRLLDEKVRTGIAGAKGGERFVPLRMYVSTCGGRDGCGRLFAKTKIDQEYCCRTCISRAGVYRFRRIERATKQLYSGKQTKQLSPREQARVEKLAESLL